MPARHAVLLTPLECAVPSSILYSKQSPPVTSLESALTSQSQLVENTATLSLVECALTSLSPATPLECAVPEKTGGGGPFFPFRKQSTPSQRQGPLVYPERSRPKIPTLSERATHHSPQFSSSFFSLSSALFPRQLTPQPKQPLWNQMFPHSLPSQRGCVRTASPFRPSNRGGGRLRVRQPLPSSPPCLPSFLSPCPTIPLPPCFLTSLQYNRCASIRGKDEFQPAFRGDTDRLRAPFLGRQHHGNLRAPILLRRLRLPRQLSSRKAEFPHRANRHAHWNLRRHGLVPGHLRRRHRRPPRFPSRALAGLPDSGCRLFSARLHWRAVARSGKGRHSPRNFCGIHPDSACVGHLDGQALRGGNNGPRLQGKRPLHRLLHLLHHGEHRRRLRPLCCLLGPPPPRRRKRFPCRSPQRLCHVLRRPSFLPRAETHRRRSPAEHRRNASEFFHRSLQPQV